ncbi:MAG: transposase [Candidatus Omnitrophica bacterium]|nr:transposase [Candidatus Omnitrophota bacterium]
MPLREPLAIGQVYHVFNRSIAEYRIFNHEKDLERMRQMIRYYGFKGVPEKFSRYMDTELVLKNGFWRTFFDFSQGRERMVEIIAYCLMPTHFHLILKQLMPNGISFFVNQSCNSYSRFFNTKYKRKGPLWEGRFESVRVETDEQLLHLTRYVHLNPVTAGLIELAEQWPASSYHEYMGNVRREERICEFRGILKIDPLEYEKFVRDRVGYQRDLARIKAIIANVHPRGVHRA